MVLLSNITEIQSPLSAATGEAIRPYCTVNLAEGSPAEGLALGWYDDEHGELIGFDGITILGPNHYSEILRPEPRGMPNIETIFTVALFEPTTDEELAETGYSWKRTNKTKSFTTANVSSQTTTCPEGYHEENGTCVLDEGNSSGNSVKKWLLIAGGGIITVLSVISIGIFLKRK